MRKESHPPAPDDCDHGDGHVNVVSASGCGRDGNDLNPFSHHLPNGYGRALIALAQRYRASSKR